MGRDKIDEKSLCKYVVNGLPDNPRDKITLFEAVAFDELKKKLKVFAASAESRNVANGQKNATKNQDKQSERYNVNSNKKPQRWTKCLNCGKDDHSRNECPDSETTRTISLVQTKVRISGSFTYCFSERRKR